MKREQKQSLKGKKKGEIPTRAHQFGANSKTQKPLRPSLERANPQQVYVFLEGLSEALRFIRTE